MAHILGTVVGDRRAGGGAADTVRSYDGNGTLSGGGDADAIFGNTGNDTLNGGDGADTVDGGPLAMTRSLAAPRSLATG